VGFWHVWALKNMSDEVLGRLRASLGVVAVVALDIWMRLLWLCPARLHNREMLPRRVTRAHALLGIALDGGVGSNLDVGRGKDLLGHACESESHLEAR
jgi:hypothetical protein